MNNPSIVILTFFVVSALVSLIVAIVKDNVHKNLTLQLPPLLFNRFLLFLLPLGVLMGLRGFFAGDALANELLFVAGALIPFVLKRIGVSATALGVIVLFGAVCVTKCGADQLPGTAAVATLLGLGVYKILENTMFGLENTFDDVLPAFIWLAGHYWLMVGIAGAACVLQENILLSCLTLALLMKALQSVFLADDKTIFKRILVSTVSGLGLLLILTKVLLVTKMAPLAALFGVAVLFTYIFEASLQNDDLASKADPIRVLVFIGVLTLIATRFYGTLGLLVLAPATVSSAMSGSAWLAGIFWISRAFVQAFISQYNSNITGINLMHAYTGAALYGGLVIVFVLSIALRDVERNWLTAKILLLSCFLLPPATIYFLHEEPSASLLISTLVSAIIVTALAPVIYKRQATASQINLIIIPCLMTAVSLLCGPLVLSGNEASSASRVQLIGWITGVLALIYLGFYFYFLKQTPGPVKPASGDG